MNRFNKIFISALFGVGIYGGLYTAITNLFRPYPLPLLTIFNMGLYSFIMYQHLYGDKE